MRKNHTLIFTTICALLSLNSFLKSEQIALGEIGDGIFCEESGSRICSMTDEPDFTSSKSNYGNQYIIEYTLADVTPSDPILRNDALKNQWGETPEFPSYSFGPKKTKVLLAKNEQPMYDGSKKANHSPCDLTAKLFAPITDFSKVKQQLADFEPNRNNVECHINSPSNFQNKLKGKYFLILEAAENNVHSQNTIEMILSLVAASKQFYFFIYPNKNHSIFGGNTHLHLYTKMTNFIQENL